MNFFSKYLKFFFPVIFCICFLLPVSASDSFSSLNDCIDYVNDSSTVVSPSYTIAFKNSGSLYVVSCSSASVVSSADSYYLSLSDCYTCRFLFSSDSYLLTSAVSGNSDFLIASDASDFLYSSNDILYGSDVFFPLPLPVEQQLQTLAAVQVPKILTPQVKTIVIIAVSCLALLLLVPVLLKVLSRFLH